MSVLCEDLTRIIEETRAANPPREYKVTIQSYPHWGEIRIGQHFIAELARNFGLPESTTLRLVQQSVRLGVPNTFGIWSKDIAEMKRLNAEKIYRDHFSNVEITFSHSSC